MKRRDLLKLFREDPQDLLTTVTFEFKEIEGHVKVTNGVAAGEPFYGFTFTDGPYAGKTLYCAQVGNDQDGAFEYECDANSDGFLFNSNDAENSNGGNCMPELNGKTFTIK